MRTITTKDGVSFEGRNIDFFDGGDHIVCQKKRSFEKIYKVNISSDRERYNDEDRALSVFLIFLFLGILLFVILGSG